MLPRKLLLLPLILLSPVMALADDCSQSCPSGEVQVSFADGNHTSCMCVTESSGMDATDETAGPTCVDADDVGDC